MNKCMTMPGGGPFGCGPGQITDDSELAMCLLHGLINGNEGQEEPVLDVDAIATMYAHWIKSNPFDIGITTRQALG